VNTIKVIVMGLGGVGIGAVRALAKKKGIEIVGALRRSSRDVGKDLGEVAGLDKKLGVTVGNDPEALFSTTYADVVIHGTTSRTLKDVYDDIVMPIEQGMDIITATTAASSPYLFDPPVAAQLEKLTRECGVTLLGTGSVQALDRIVLALTEQCNEVSYIKRAVHSDVSQFSKESTKTEFGIGLSPEEYRKEVAKGGAQEFTDLKGELQAFANRIGWPLDEVKAKTETSQGDDGLIIGNKSVCQGIKDGKVLLEMSFEGILDPKHEYFHNIVVEGIPRFEAMIKYSPDRGLQGTIAPMLNAIPHVVSAEPGIIEALELPLSFVLQDDVRMLLS
jgi:4-hydroxy-tetrahydrodipicolinate reductase